MKRTTKISFPAAGGRHGAGAAARRGPGVAAPGHYACRIKDATGQTIRTKDIPVLYTGQKPRIIQQPSGLTVTPDEKGKFSFSLSCEAVSGNGDQSCLEYRWEWKNLDGDWRYLENGRTFDGTWVGSYRCKVIDVVSNQYAYTQVVNVAEKLTSRYESEAIPHTSNVDCYLNITGGAAPYIVNLYLEYDSHWIEEGFEYYKTVVWLYATYTVNTMEEAKRYHCCFPEKYYYTHYEDGQWKNAWAYYHVYAITTDVDGRTTTLDISW